MVSVQRRPIRCYEILGLPVERILPGWRRNAIIFCTKHVARCLTEVAWLDSGFSTQRKARARSASPFIGNGHERFRTRDGDVEQEQAIDRWRNSKQIRWWRRDKCRTCRKGVGWRYETEEVWPASASLGQRYPRGSDWKRYIKHQEVITVHIIICLYEKTAKKQLTNRFCGCKLQIRMPIPCE